MTIGKTNSGQAVPINVQRLIETRALVAGGSGAGKSWALRRLLEQTHGQIQQIVIDVEDEFHSLREKFDYILAGRTGGDCPADPRSAALLARRLLELNVSAIIGIYELKAHDRIRFVRLFLEELVNAPKDLWHPVLVVIDEAHVFAPENGKAESAQAVIDLMTRGRKRGFAGILATQRPAALDKNASAQCINKLIGRFSQDIDVKRAADDIGFYSRQDQAKLRSLKPGTFFITGPAFCEEVTEVEIGPVATTHPRAGQRAITPTPARGTVIAALAKLADLPAEAEQEAKSIETLQSENRSLKGELSRAKSPQVDPAAIENARAEAHAQALKDFDELVVDFSVRMKIAIDDTIVGLRHGLSLLSGPKPSQTAQPARLTSGPVSPPVRKTSPPAEASSSVGSGALRILKVLAQRYPAKFSKQQWATLAGMKHTGGSWGTYLSRLRTAGYLAQDGALYSASEQGMAAVGQLPLAPSGTKEIVRMWSEALGGGAARMLDVIVDRHPRPVTRERLAEALEMTASGGSFGTYLSRLRSNGLIETTGSEIRAGAILFE